MSKPASYFISHKLATSFNANGGVQTSLVHVSMVMITRLVLKRKEKQRGEA